MLKTLFRASIVCALLVSVGASAQTSKEELDRLVSEFSPDARPKTEFYFELMKEIIRTYKTGDYAHELPAWASVYNSVKNRGLKLSEKEQKLFEEEVLPLEPDVRDIIETCYSFPIVGGYKVYHACVDMFEYTSRMVPKNLTEDMQPWRNSLKKKGLSMKGECK